RCEQGPRLPLPPAQEFPTMTIAEQFQQLAAAWTRHCEQMQFSSNPVERLRHPAFRQLIEVGPPVVPLIMARFAADRLVPWEFVLQEVSGVRMIDDPTDFSPEEVRHKRLAWWQKEQSRYPTVG